MKIAKSSPVGRYGGEGDLGDLEIASGSPIIGEKFHEEENSKRDWGLNQPTVTAICQPTLPHCSANNPQPVLLRAKKDH